MSRKFIAAVLVSAVALTGMSATQSFAQSAQNRNAQAATLFLGTAAAIFLLHQANQGSSSSKAKVNVKKNQHAPLHARRSSSHKTYPHQGPKH